MATKDFIPRPNGAFNDWQENFVKEVTDNISLFDLSDDALAEWTTLTTATGNKKKRWDSIWDIIKTRQFTRAQEGEMIAARKDYENGHKDMPTDTSLRIFISRYLRNNPKVTVQQKLDMGITVPDTTPTSMEVNVVKAEGNELASKIKKNEHLLHIVEVTGVAQYSLALGKGVKEVQIFIAFTEATCNTPPNLSAFAYDGVLTRGRYKRFFEPQDEGKRAWYFARVMVKGRNVAYSSPSPFISAVIW